MAEIEFNEVSKVYDGGTEAVSDLNLKIEDGEMMVLVGPSGCGKTTALRMAAGLENITRGELRIGDRIVNHVTPKERNIAMVFQNYALYPHMTVEQNLAFSLKLHRLPKDEISRRVRNAAKTLEIEELLKRKPRALSGGQRQRVAMGRAMVRNPKVFLYDEPLSNLDLELRVRLRLEIARLQRSLKSTAVYVTHDQTEAMTLADQIVVLRKGRIEQVGAPLALYRAPANLFVAGFIGTPRINLFALSEVSELADVGTQMRVGTSTLRVPQRFARPPRTLGFRPEHAHVGEAAPQQIALALKGCETQAIEHLGDRAYAYLRGDLGDLVVLTREAQQELVGDVRLAVDVAALHFFDADGVAIR